MGLSLVHRPTHPMTDPKNSEAPNEELDLEQLEEAAGGLGTTAGPGGTSFPKTNIGGNASPGGDDG